MKKIFLILFLVFLVGCSKPVVKDITLVEEVEIEVKQIEIAVDIIEKSVHNYIVAAKPQGIYVSLKVEITNVGDVVANITKEDIMLKEGENEYSIDEYASAYMNDNFRDISIHPKNDVSARLVFDVPDSKKDFVLVVKGKEVKV